MIIESGSIKSVDVYDWDLLHQVRDNFYPEDVFTTDQLDRWAEENGYVKEEEK
jgi:hypothetical protein